MKAFESASVELDLKHPSLQASVRSVRRYLMGGVPCSVDLEFLPGTASAGFLLEEQVQDRKERCTKDQLARCGQAHCVDDLSMQHQQQ